MYGDVTSDYGIVDNCQSSCHNVYVVADQTMSRDAFTHESRSVVLSSD